MAWGLKDKYSARWQIVPDAPGEIVKNKDPVERQRVMRPWCRWSSSTSQGSKSRMADN